MPLKRKKKPKVSRDSVEALFEDMLHQVERGVQRMEALERDVASEQEARSREAWEAAERFEALQRSSRGSLEAAQAALDGESATFAAERAALESALEADRAAFRALAAARATLVQQMVDGEDEKEERPAAAPPKRNDDASELLGALRRGLPVVKHSRRGKPKKTVLFLDDEDALRWARSSKDVAELSRRRQPTGADASRQENLVPEAADEGPSATRPTSSTSTTSAATRSPNGPPPRRRAWRRVRLARRGHAVLRGKHTPNFARDAAKRVDADRCLSVVVAAHDVDEAGRTPLDVEAACARSATRRHADALLAERANHVLKDPGQGRARHRPQGDPRAAAGARDARGPARALRRRVT
ncbi:hypothetical protein JL720_10861 [Aureococcus anophagefferens]|nr:hypothetical protein JL720_10861 [Aureococcus anophagefferens]